MIISVDIDKAFHKIHSFTIETLNIPSAKLGIQETFLS